MNADEQPYRSTREEPALWFLGLPTLVRAGRETTNGRFGLVVRLEPYEAVDAMLRGETRLRFRLVLPHSFHEVRRHADVVPRCRFARR